MRRIFPDTGGRDGTIYRRIRNQHLASNRRRKCTGDVWCAYELHIRKEYKSKQVIKEGWI